MKPLIRTIIKQILNAVPSTQTSEPSNGQLPFAPMRNVLAELYSEENAAYIADDAWLDAIQIVGNARAQTNWHHILTEAMGQNCL